MKSGTIFIIPLMDRGEQRDSFAVSGLINAVCPGYSGIATLFSDFLPQKVCRDTLRDLTRRLLRDHQAPSECCIQTDLARIIKGTRNKHLITRSTHNLAVTTHSIILNVRTASLMLHGGDVDI